MDAIDIFCALTERKFTFSWPEGIWPTDWIELKKAVERQVGGEFNHHVQSPGVRLSVLTITSDKNDSEIIASISEIIREYLPTEKQIDQRARTVFWGAVIPDTDWKR